MSSVRKRHIIPVFTDRLVGRTDDFSVVCELFHAVCAPADHSCDGKDGGEQLGGQAKHFVNEAGVEIHVDAYALVHLAFAGDNLRRKLFYQIVKLKFFMQSLLFGELLNEGFEDDGSRVGFGIDRMADAIDQTRVIEGIRYQVPAERIKSMLIY